MTNSISNRQMVFVLFLTLTTYSTIELPKAMTQTAGRSSWIPILIVSLLFGISAAAIAKLNKMFLGKVLFDYSQEIVGKFLTYLIIFYFILYYFYVGIVLEIKMVTLLSSMFLPNTPNYELVLFSVPLFAFVAHKGVTNVARLFELFGILFLLLTVGICTLMIMQGDKYNLIPLLYVPKLSLFARAMKELIVPFGGSTVLFIVPFTQKNKKAPLTSFLTVLFIGIFYILTVESTLMILGINNTIIYKGPFIQALMITQAPVIERLDIFYLTVGLTSLFSGIIIVLTTITEMLCRMFSKTRRVIIVTFVGISFCLICLFGINFVDFQNKLSAYTIYLVLIACFVIPFILLICARVKLRD